MNKDLHDIDKLFRSALEGHEEIPSAGVKENLDAALDKQDAEKYKKRFIIWKRAALLLLLLLAGFVLYESGIIKTANRHYTSKNTVADKNNVHANNNETINQNKNTPVGSNNESVANDNKVTQKSIAEDEQIQQQITGVPKNSDVDDNIIASQNNNRQNKQVNILTQKQDPLFSAPSSQADKKTTAVADYDTSLQTAEKGIVPLDERVSIANVAEWLVKKISSLQPIIVSNSPFTASKTNDSKNKKVKSFKSFWMVAPFASYEQSGYKLDSDDPLIATTIKHREVHEPSFSGGILATRQITSHWGLQSGLLYTSTQIGISPQKMYALQLPGGDIAYKFITSSGYAYIKLGIGQPPAVGDSITTSDAKHLLQHISVPFSVKYKIGKNKFTLSPSAGIEANFITNAKVEVGVDLASNREIVTVKKMEGIKPFYWSAVTGVEASYQLNKKLSVNVQPVLRYALSPTTKDNVVETFPRSFGIRAGMTIKF